MASAGEGEEHTELYSVDAKPLDQEKVEAMRYVLNNLGIALVHLDPRGDEVLVPGRFKSQPVLRLQYAWGFNLSHFAVDDDGVSALLSFGTEKFNCFVPWSAIFAITAPEHNNRGYGWEQSAPSEVVSSLTSAASRPVAPEGGPGGARRRPQLRIISRRESEEPNIEVQPPISEANDKPEPAPTPAPEPAKKPERGRPHLRVVE